MSDLTPALHPPKRIQRKRAKGWRMPDGVVYVGRPTRWGNPYAGLPSVDLELSLELYTNSARGMWLTAPVRHLSDEALQNVYAAHTAWTRRIAGHPLEAIRAELSRTDLACWCPLDRPCHADVLLELANPTAASGPYATSTSEDRDG